MCCEGASPNSGSPLQLLGELLKATLRLLKGLAEPVGAPVREAVEVRLMLTVAEPLCAPLLLL